MGNFTLETPATYKHVAGKSMSQEEAEKILNNTSSKFELSEKHTKFFAIFLMLCTFT